MASLPALSRSYFTRGNVLFPSTVTQNMIESWFYRRLYTNLTNTETGGSTGGSRNANSVWIVRGSSNGVSASATTAAGVAGTDQWAKATAVLKTSGTINNGETVTIGTKTYTFQTTLTNVDGNVLIGASHTNSMSNLAAAINLGSGAGTTYAAATTANTFVSASSTTNYADGQGILNVAALSAGSAGYSIALGETCANATWSGTTLTGEMNKQTNSNPHPWILLENTFLGRELLLNYALNTGYIAMSMGPIGTWPVGAGTVSQFPVASPTSASVQVGQVSYASAEHGQDNYYGTDITSTNTLWRAHFTCADNGEFWYATSRGGTGVFNNFIALAKTTGQQVGDTRNFYFIAVGNSSGRGAMGNNSNINTPANWAALSPSGSQKSLGGPVMWAAAGTILQLGYGLDVLSSQYLSTGVDMIDLAPQYVRRGTIPDWYFIGDAPVGSSVPSMAAQERVIVGNLILPCNSVVLSI